MLTDTEIEAMCQMQWSCNTLPAGEGYDSDVPVLYDGLPRSRTQSANQVDDARREP